MLTIFISFQLVGFHRWKDAVKLCPEQAHLANRHRHMFFFECEKEVTHDDRDIEILQFKQLVTMYLIQQYDSSTSNACEFGDNSCEMLARELALQFNLLKVSVKEDNENGAIYRDPKYLSI